MSPQGGSPAAHACLCGSAGPPQRSSWTKPCSRPTVCQEQPLDCVGRRGLHASSHPTGGLGTAGPGWAWGQCALGRGRGATPALGSRGPCVFSENHWSLIRVPSQEYHPLNVTPLSQIGLVGMGKWELTPLYPLNSP